jgi:DNA-directed RNA polymerase subunit RPC12/RpoP
MSIQFSRYQCRACGKPALHVRSQYVPPHLGYLIVLGFLSVDALITRDPLIASYCVLGAVAVAGLWALHAIVSLFTGGESYRCQSCGTEVGSSQRAI